MTVAEPAQVTIGQVVDRLRAAWADVAASEAGTPADPLAAQDLDAAYLVGEGTEEPVALETRFDLVAGRLGLDPVDRALLALAVLPDLHPAFGFTYAYLHEDPARRAASPRLAARLLAGPGASDADLLLHLDVEARLRTSGAVRLRGTGPAADRALVPGPLLLAYLLGTALEPEHRALRRIDPPVLPAGRLAVVQRLQAVLGAPQELPLVVAGADATAVLAEAAGTGLVCVEARAALEDDAAADLALAAALEARVPVLDALGDLPAEGRPAALTALQALASEPVFLAVDAADALVLADIAVLQVEVPGPGLPEREAAWRAATGLQDVGEVPDRFRLGVDRIGEAAAVAQAEARLRGSEVTPDLLALGARLASSRRIGEIAERMVPGPGWDELVLPPRQLRALQALVAFLGHREQVLGDWGFDRIAGRSGYVALFAGESGTGKTLSARVVASEAGLDVYRVDLAQLFSKWVGETEKNLDRVFSAAAGSNAVLFFDEADVVFGKRSATSSSSDRYANLETAYLLQRIEAYEGVVVLATNLRSSIDPAFVRRLDVVVDFPPPDAEVRRALWDRLLPAQAPRAADLELDFLADRFELSGGGIRNCTVTAAFLAAEQEREIRTEDLVRAIAIEFEKQGRLVVEADFERFHQGL